MKKVLVTGASGQLGLAIVDRFSDHFKLILTDSNIPEGFNREITRMDITDEISVSKTIEKSQPDILLHLAAMTDVDVCDDRPKKAMEVNVNGTKNLLKYFSGTTILISTDYVFNGKDGPYSEEDQLDPINEYGRTKFLAEKAVINSGNLGFILRTNVVFDYSKNTEASFVKWVVDSLRSERSIKVVNDQWNNPIWTVALADVILKMIKKNLSGVWHYGGADYLSRLDFAKMIANVFQLEPSLISPCTTQELNQKAPRPLKGGLKTEKIEAIGIIPYPLEKSLKDIFERMQT